VSDIGLPDGGIPPQATQLAAPLASIGLADGGVPPQASIQAGIPPQPQVQAPQVPLSTQPLDLSVLGVTDSGKTPAPASLPSSVRPGQVNLPFYGFSFLYLIFFSFFCQGMLLLLIEY
jgi:hypothetical protein